VGRSGGGGCEGHRGGRRRFDAFGDFGTREGGGECGDEVVGDDAEMNCGPGGDAG